MQKISLVSAGRSGLVASVTVFRLTAGRHVLARVLGFELETERFANVAGMPNLKRWLEQRGRVFRSGDGPPGPSKASRDRTAAATLVAFESL